MSRHGKRSELERRSADKVFQSHDSRIDELRQQLTGPQLGNVDLGQLAGMVRQDSPDLARLWLSPDNTFQTNAMSHDALARSGGGHKTDPNAWFVGMAPRRNPDIVVAVLWEHGNWGNNSAKLAAQVIDAYYPQHRASGYRPQVVGGAT